ncbi:MAG: chemotaxis protein CheX [Acidobacteriota bacterium]
MDRDSAIRNLIEATREVFGKMITIPLGEDPTFETEAEARRCEIVGMVSLAGRSMGVVSLHCSPRLGLLIASNLLGSPVTEVGEELEDAVGEVTNMVAGNFKTRMSQEGEMFDLSVPTVIMGKDFSVKTMTGAPTLVLGFRWESEKLLVRLNMRL